MQCGLDMVLGEVPKNSPEILKGCRRPSVFALSRASDVVDLQDHPDYLSGQ